MTENATPRKRPGLLVVVFASVLGLIVLTIMGFLLWLLVPSPPNSVATTALASDETVSVSDAGWLEFSPRNSAALSSAMATLNENSTTLPDATDQDNTATPETPTQTIGFILYPGAHIDYHAYAPLAREIAKAGYLTIITPMPLNLAILNQDAAKNVMAAYPAVTRWVVGGHSMGGTAMAAFVDHFAGPDGSKDSAGKVAGLVFWGSISMDDLSANQKLPVLSISADQDGNTPPTLIEQNKSKLPTATIYKMIKGGNHAQFGCYGVQFGDHPATISPEEQRKQVIAATLDFLDKLSNPE